MGNPQLADAVQAAAGELYGLPAEAFTAARNQRAKQAKDAGDRDLAASIGKLAKPNLTAWLANQLVRAHPAEVAELLALGATMRQATANLDADQLRQLSRQQRQLIRTLVQQATALASSAGHAVSDSTDRALQDTLHAALADEQAARQLRLGQLTSGLSHSGFPGFGLATGTARSAVAAKRPATKRASGGEDEAAARRAAVEQAAAAEAEAREDVGLTIQARQQAAAALSEAELAARAAADLVRDLRADLDAALAADAAAQRQHRTARKAADSAGQAATAAERRLDAAIARSQELDPQTS